MSRKELFQKAKQIEEQLNNGEIEPPNGFTFVYHNIKDLMEAWNEQKTYADDYDFNHHLDEMEQLYGWKTDRISALQADENPTKKELDEWAEARGIEPHFLISEQISDPNIKGYALFEWSGQMGDVPFTLVDVFENEADIERYGTEKGFI